MAKANHIHNAESGYAFSSPPKRVFRSRDEGDGSDVTSPQVIDLSPISTYIAEEDIERQTLRSLLHSSQAMGSLEKLISDDTTSCAFAKERGTLRSIRGSLAGAQVDAPLGLLCVSSILFPFVSLCG
ncbi:hypothetical protein Q1695_001708 [Nippostrongylus brasiliensis]|nr:hypothetical protein Q1695_001708 [Nippostrongylus brasiliensis]